MTRTAANGYRAVLWDFGGVLSTSPFESFARLERDRGIPEGFIRRVNATNPDDNAWARFERNQIDLGQFDVAFADESAALGHRIDGRDVLGCLAGDIRPEMVRAVARCREHGLRTALLTNNVVAMDGWHDGLGEPSRQARRGGGDDGLGEPSRQARRGGGGNTGRTDPLVLDELFDVVVESSKAGVRKPDPAAYELVLELLGVEAHEVVFLDDLGINLKPARAIGMATIKVEATEPALDALEGLLGLPVH